MSILTFFAQHVIPKTWLEITVFFCLFFYTELNQIWVWNKMRVNKQSNYNQIDESIKGEILDVNMCKIRLKWVV